MEAHGEISVTCPVLKTLNIDVGFKPEQEGFWNQVLSVFRLG